MAKFSSKRQYAVAYAAAGVGCVSAAPRFAAYTQRGVPRFWLRPFGFCPVFSLSLPESEERCQRTTPQRFAPPKRQHYTTFSPSLSNRGELRSRCRMEVLRRILWRSTTELTEARILGIRKAAAKETFGRSAGKRPCSVCRNYGGWIFRRSLFPQPLSVPPKAFPCTLLVIYCA